MASGVQFGSPSVLIRQPGAYTKVDASALNFAPTSSFNVVCIMGAALGGAPMVPYLFTDPLQAQELFGVSTPLSEGVRFAFMGGANGGAAVVVGVRVDNCEQAYGSLLNSQTGTGIDGKFKDFGAYGNTFSVSFMPGSTAGTMAVIRGSYPDGREYVKKIDNETSFSRLVERITAESAVDITITAGGVRASQTLQLATSQIDGRATLTDSQAVQRTNQGYIYQYPATMVANTVDSMVVSLNTAIGWAIASINTTTGTWTTSTPHTFTAGNAARLSGTTLPPEVSASKNYIIYASASNTTFQVAEALATPTEFTVTTFNDGSDLLTAPGNTLVNGDVVQVSGGIPTGATLGRNYFVVGKSGDDFQISLTFGGTAIALSGSISNMKVLKVAGGLLAISGSVAGATVTLLPGLSTVSASNPTDFNGTRLAANTSAAYSQVIANAVITATAYSSDSARFTLASGETWGHLGKKGLPGTIFEIATGIYTGTYQILHQEWDGLSNDRVRIVRKLSGDRRIAEGVLSATLAFWGFIQYPRLQPATKQLESRLPANGLLATGGQYLTVVINDQTVYYPTEIGDTIASVAEQITGLINSTDEVLATASYAYNSSTYTATITILADTPGAIANNYPINLLVNSQDTLLTSAGGTRLSGGVDPSPPRNAQGIISGVLTLSNGFDSAPTYQRWLEGLDAITDAQVRYIVAAGTDDLGVQTAIADHCALMSSTPKRRERMAVVAHGNGWTKQQILERGRVFQSERVVFVSASRKSLRMADATTGLYRAYPMHYAAAITAGILAAEGNGISDPITHSYLKNVILEDPYQSGSSELDEMIAAGVLTIERDASLTRVSRGYRVTRAITTWRIDGQSALKSNAFESISVVNQSDFIAADIREMEESLFIGTAIFGDTLIQVRTAVNLRLARRKRDRVIYGYDPAFTQVTLNQDSPNALDVAYRVFPAPDLSFILNTQLLLPISAETAA